MPNQESYIHTRIKELSDARSDYTLYRPKPISKIQALKTLAYDPNYGSHTIDILSSCASGFIMRITNIEDGYDLREIEYEDFITFEEAALYINAAHIMESDSPLQERFISHPTGNHSY